MKLQEMTLNKFLEELACRKPVPGGGSVSALSGALAAGLVSMAAEFSGDSGTAEKSRRLGRVLISLVDKDAEAFVGGDLREATEIPLQTARYAYEVLKLARVLLQDCNPRLITDIGVAAKVAEAAVEGALLNVRVNLISIEDEEYEKEILKAAQKLRSAGSRSRAILSQVQARLH
ncbi:MAG: hypothetical protein E3J50_04965 [Dehalococcoidia bacterium]|nr:MAG: hypothetical protein E3J50_04965 [Dehalococcoidia bacterium]